MSNPGKFDHPEQCRVLVVGAVGGMGRWITEKILSREKRLHLTLTDVDGRVRDLANELSRSHRLVMGRPMSFAPDGTATGISDPASYDVIVIAVPTGEIARVSKAVVSRAKPGALVVDVASEKVEPLRLMQEAAPPGVSVLGTHPMFGPRVESLIGQTVVICETPSTDPRHLEQVTQLVQAYGGKTHLLTPEEHDEQMTVVQSLPHFVHLALGETFRQGQLNIRDTLPIQTPPFHSAISVLGRMVDLPSERQAELYATIQRSPGSSELRKAFIEAAIELDKCFDEEDLAASLEAIVKLARSFPGSAIDQLSAQSDEAVQARQALEVELHRLKESGEVCAFESSAGKIAIGRIIDFGPVSVILSGNVLENRGKKAAIYDDESAKAAALHGIAGLPKENPLLRHHHRLLRAEEVQLWREAELDSHERDITLGVPEIANYAAVAGYLMALIPAVLDAEVKQDFDRPEDESGVRWVTFHLKIIGDRHPDRVIPAVIEFVESIGGQGPRVSTSPPAAPAPAPDPASTS